MPGAVFHKGPAEIAIRETPSLSEVLHAEPHVYLGFEQAADRTSIAKHRRGLRSYLHEPDLAHSTDGGRVEPAFNLGNGVSYSGRQPGLFRLPGNQVQIC